MTPAQYSTVHDLLHTLSNQILVLNLTVIMMMAILIIVTILKD